MDDDAIIAKAHAAGLQVFRGFKERSYRLVYENEDASAKEKWVDTILPNGDIEMQKPFQPRKGKGIMTFGYPQYIHKDDAGRYFRRPEGPGNFIHYDDQPDCCAYPLVQTWTVKVNDNFHNEFEIMNVDQLKGQIDGGFHMDAIVAFRKSMAKCFSGAEVDKYPIKCCRMKREKQNKELVVVGPRSDVEGFLQNPYVQKSFFVSADGHGFKAWSKPKGKWLPQWQRFEWGTDMNEIYVLYTRIGNSEMTCMMKRRQFVREKTFGELIGAKKQTVCHTVEIPNERNQEFKLEIEGLCQMSIDKVLGQGQFSVVVLVHSQAQQYALKMLKLGRAGPMKLERLRREKEIGKFLREKGHPFFVKTFVSFELPKDVVWETSSGKSMPKNSYNVAILLEYIEGGTLYTAIEYDIMEQPAQLVRLTKYRRWAAEVAEAMRFLHGLGIVYRDLKPDNVMLKPMPHKQRSFACLGDWGFAKNTKLWGVAESAAGETIFAAPEVPKAQLQQPWKEYTQHCDVFSFGRMLKAMVACTLSDHDIVSQEFDEDFPHTAKDLVVKATIDKPPAQRGHFRDVCEHAFFGAAAFGDASVPPINFPGLVQDAMQQS